MYVYVPALALVPQRVCDDGEVCVCVCVYVRNCPHVRGDRARHTRTLAPNPRRPGVAIPTLDAPLADTPPSYSPTPSPPDVHQSENGSARAGETKPGSAAPLGHRPSGCVPGPPRPPRSHQSSSTVGGASGYHALQNVCGHCQRLAAPKWCSCWAPSARCDTGAKSATGSEERTGRSPPPG